MNENCEYLTQRDAMWYGRERHDSYCLYRLEWCPDCRGCQYNRKEKEEDE